MPDALDTLRTLEPDLQFDPVQVRRANGQFSDVLLIDEIGMVFRLPRSPHVAATMAAEVDLLNHLHGHITLPIPRPTVDHRDPETGAQILMGYPLIPGEPLTRARFQAIRDEGVLPHIAAQLADFLRDVHTFPIDATNRVDPQAQWQNLYDQFREQLYPYMRADAQAQVSADFEAFLGDGANFAFEPVLIHGDLGGSNILFDAEQGCISGVIDFGGATVGDPAQDVGALRVSFGDAFLGRIFSHNPALQQTMSRVTFIQSTYALQQALYALRDGNQDDFDDGIQAYI